MTTQSQIQGLTGRRTTSAGAAQSHSGPSMQETIPWTDGSGGRPATR
ncbi:MAG: hypothetical protein MSS75_01615 [Megasphaera sp.]|nr:hypothetical protein [Megasphaera sp.]MCF0153000.1 hypothetical protein [Megasphaera sp.]MCI7599744.1 hypothetical protein [Megasphaera sp.]